MAKQKTKRHHRETSKKHHSESSNHHLSNIAIGATAGCLLAAAASYAANRNGSKSKAMCFAKECLEKIEDSTAHLLEKPQPSSNKLTAIGAVGGGLLGAGALLYYLAKEDKLPTNFLKSPKASKWMEIAKVVGDNLNKTFLHSEEEDYLEQIEEGRDKLIHGVKNIVDWGLAGLTLWKEIKKRR